MADATNTIKNSSRAMRSGSAKLMKKRIKKFCNNWLSVLGFIIVFVFVVACLAAPLLTSYDPMRPEFIARFAKPGPEHYFGCDQLGRDLFARVLYGGRTSMLIAFLGTLGGSVIGLVMAGIGGYISTKADKVLLRVADLFMTFPQTILIMICTTFMGQGVMNLVYIFAFTGWAGSYRTIRAQILSLREETYVEVCRSFGMSKARVFFTQMVPSVLTLVVIEFTMTMPGYIMSEAGLSFLGIGVPQTVCTWGTMLTSANTTDVFMNYIYAVLVPGFTICLFVLGLTFLGDGLRDVVDPRQQ